MTKYTLIAALGALVATSSAAEPAGKSAPQAVSRAAMAKRFDARFAQIDKNKDGSLSRAEIDAAHAQFVGLTKAVVGTEIRQEFAATDANKDGQASLAEMTAATPPEGRAGVPKALARLDTNKDGTLSLAEFAAALPPPSIGSAADFLKRFDGNKDGAVSRAEYSSPGLAAFDQVDANNDGKITPDERKASAAKTR